VRGPERETLVELPRGCGKTSLAAWLSVHHLLTHERPGVYFGAASVAQARIAFEAALELAEHPAIADQLVRRHLEIRRADRRGVIRMVPSDGPRTHGLAGSLYVLDELWAARDDGLYLSFRSALAKRPDARLLVISTADAGPDRPLVRLRARALAAPKVKRSGALTDCSGDGLRALLWEVAPDVRASNLRAVAAANPASWITPELLEEQRRALPEHAFLRFHGNSPTAQREGAWLPPGAWQACLGQPRFEPGEPIWVGVDVGAERSHTAVVWINASLHVGAAIWEGEQGILRAVERIEELAERYQLVEVVADPWRFGQAGLELEQRGVTVVTWPQTDVRLVPASQRLRDAVVEGRLVLPDDARLAQHAANAVQRHSRRGWRLERPDRSSPIDGLIALCMALERCESRPEPVRLLGWLG